MIIKLYTEYEDPQGMKISYQFKDVVTQTNVATATDYFNEATSLYFNDEKFEFLNYPKIITRPQINYRYPLSKSKKNVGFHITKNQEPVVSFFTESATCGKRWIFNQNILFTVYVKNEKPYLLFRVGFKNQNSHYYCLYDNSEKCIAIIERHSFYDDNCKATLYIENEENLLITLMACTDRIISVANSGSSDDMMDSSAGNYISLLAAEKEMFDKNFLERVKNQ